MEQKESFEFPKLSFYLINQKNIKNHSNSLLNLFEFHVFGGFFLVDRVFPDILAQVAAIFETGVLLRFLSTSLILTSMGFQIFHAVVLLVHFFRVLLKKLIIELFTLHKICIKS